MTEGAADKWYISLSFVTGQTMLVNIEGTPFATQEAAMIAKDVFKDTIEYLSLNQELVDILYTVEAGVDGYTPIKGVDYFDGYTPIFGIDYFDGEDGIDGAMTAEEMNIQQIRIRLLLVI